MVMDLQVQLEPEAELALAFGIGLEPGPELVSELSESDPGLVLVTASEPEAEPGLVVGPVAAPEPEAAQKTAPGQVLGIEPV